jgi:hypothetical protein
MKPPKRAPTESRDPSATRGIDRRTAIGMSAATVLQLMFADSRGAEAATTPAAPLSKMSATSDLRQLAPAEGLGWLRKQLATNVRAQRFQQAFEQQKYQFILERARVYVVGNQTLAIMPSYIPAKRTDASHRSVSISISSAGTVAAGALISHSPQFEVTEFTIYDLDAAGALIGTTISASDLTSAAPDQLVQKLRTPAVKPSFTTSNLSGAGAADLDKIGDMFYRQVIADKYASPLYPPDGVRSMLAQVPVIQKFSEVAGMYYSRGVGINAAKATIACTSTSSNACTSCSVIFSLKRIE